MGEIRLAGTCWKLNAFRRGDSITPAAPGADLTLRFDAAGGAEGFGGRRAFRAVYEERDGTISISGLEAFGPDLPEATEQEDRFLASLRAAVRFKAVDGQLLVSWNGGREALLFEAAPLRRSPQGAR